jgi:hypothetical protein
MNRAEAQAILDSAHAAADAIVAARPELSYSDSEALHGRLQNLATKRGLNENQIRFAFPSSRSPRAQR